MNPEQIVAELRQRLAQSGSTFMIIYTVFDVASGEVAIRLGSNSSKLGIRTLLSVLIAPTEKAITLLQTELQIDEDRAREIFSKLKDQLTVKGWEHDEIAKG